MNRKKWRFLPLLLAALLLAGCGGGGTRMGTAGQGGVYYAFGNAFAKVVKAANGPAIEVRETAGSAANLRLLDGDYLQLAIAQNDLLAEALTGTGAYSGKALKGFSAIAQLYTEAFHIVVRADSDIEVPADLLGHTVSVGEKESGTERSAESVLAAAGLAGDTVVRKNMNYTEAAAALKNKEIDAMFCTAGIGNDVVAGLAKELPVRILPVEGRLRTNLLSAHPALDKIVIPAGTYEGQDEDVMTMGIGSILVASDKLDAKTVKNLTGLLFANAEALKKEVPSLSELTPANAVDGIVVPFHKGAAEYYTELGFALRGKEE